MLDIENQLREGSKLPPRVIQKILRLSGSERREYLSVLIANYSLKTCNIDAVARKMGEQWIVNQYKHLASVIDELQGLLDVDLGKSKGDQGVLGDGTTAPERTERDGILRRGQG